MKNRMVLTAVLISAFLLLAVIGMKRFSVKANFVFPPSNPAINIESPTDRTYNVTTLSVKVTFQTYKTGYFGGPANETTRWFTYSLDGKTPEPLNITNYSVARNPGGNVSFEGAALLTELAEGPHNLTVHVVFDYFNNPQYATIYRHSESESTVSFTVDTKQPSKLTVPVVAASVTIASVAIGLLVYFKKHNGVGG